MAFVDPGLQPQRTSLAWSRTALALGVNALLVLRAGVQSGDALLFTLGGLAALHAVAIATLAIHRKHQLARHPCAPGTAVVAITAISVVVAAVGGMWAMLR